MRVVLRASFVPLLLTALVVMAAGLSGTALAIELPARRIDGFLSSALLGSSHLGVLLGAVLAAAASRRLGTSGMAIVGAALALVSTLALAFTPTPAWVVLRLIHGIGMVWVFAACETLLGGQPEAIRPLSFAGYMIVSQLGLALGQLLVPVVAGSFALALAIAAGLNLAIIGIASRHKQPTTAPSASPSPVTTRAERLPISVLSCAVAAGLFTGAVLNTGPLLAASLGQAPLAAHFVAAILLAGLALQVPAARLAKTLGADRTLALAGAVLAMMGIALHLARPSSFGPLAAMGSVLGALGFLIYPLTSQRALERVRDETERAAIPGQLLLCYGAGAAAAPFAAELAGPGGSGAAVVMGLAGALAWLACSRLRVPRRLAISWAR